MNFIFKCLFQYTLSRLPHKLSVLTLRYNVFWANQINELGREFDIRFDEISSQEWLCRSSVLLQQIKSKDIMQMKENALKSSTRFYKHLDHNKGLDYISKTSTQQKITTIFKTRCDILPLKANNFNILESKTCSLCNTGEDESLLHFMAKCPVLREFRIRHLDKPFFNENELINILNGEIPNGWNRLYNFVTNALNYRKHIIEEFI